MSFDATEWALSQPGIRPSAKLVLFCLASEPVDYCKGMDGLVAEIDRQIYFISR